LPKLEENPVPIWIKYLLTAALVVAISEAAKRSDRLGALIGALPWMSILAMAWILHDTGNAEKVSKHAWYTFWYVLPTLPMFLLLPYLLRQGTHFGWALLAGAALTLVLLLIEVLILRRFGIDLL